MRQVIYWTTDSVMAESRKYGSRSEFNKKSCGAYNYARKHNMLGLMTWFKTPEHCDRADGQRHCVYGYFDENSKAVYVGLTIDIARRDREHRRCDDSAVHMYFCMKTIPNPVILKEHLDVKSAQYYENYFVNYYKSIGYNILNKAKTGIGVGSVGSYVTKWNCRTVIEESRKYGSRKEFAENSGSAYQYAARHGMLDSMTWLVAKIKPLTIDDVISESRKYGSKGEFAQKSPRYYKYAWSHKMLSGMYWLNGKLTMWSDESVKAEGSKYRSRSEFKKKSGSAYQYALRNGLLETIFK